MTLATLFDHPSLIALPAFITSLSIGLLMGLERERSPAAKAGLRTFALTALLGTLCALLAKLAAAPWLIVGGLLAVGFSITFAYLFNGRRTHPPESNDPGTTTEIALLLCYGLGVLCWYEQRTLAVMLGIAATVLLHFKTELAGMARRLSGEELRSMLQFAVLSLVVLPILPNQDFGPYAAFNPYQTWLMVVLISGVSLAGYLALRWFGEQAGARIAGVLGGLVSSTATTMLHARQARLEPARVPFAATVVVLANLTVLMRLTVVAAIAAPMLAPMLAMVLGCGLLAGLLLAWPLLRQQQQAANLPQVGNPTELKAAIGFGLLYSVVLLAAAWLSDLAGQGGLYLVALASGVTDVDAITLSSLHLHAQQRLLAEQAITAIVLAITANSVFKTTLAFSLGGRTFGRSVLGPMLAANCGSLLGLLLLWHRSLPQ